MVSGVRPESARIITDIKCLCLGAASQVDVGDLWEGEEKLQ